MVWRTTLSFLLVFLIAFALGYLLDFPNEIKITFDVKENAMKLTEDMKNWTYNCPSCKCECISKNGYDTGFKYIQTNAVNYSKGD